MRYVFRKSNLKNLKSEYKKENGITLVVLSITVVLMLLLAVVVINISFGDQGIIKKTEAEKENYLNQAADEETLIGSVQNKLNNLNEKNTGVNKIKDYDVVFSVIPSTWTNGNVTVKIAYNSRVITKLQYQIDAIDENGWKDYDNNNITFTQNAIIYVRDVNKPYDYISKKIKNIDKIAPDVTLEKEIKSNYIKINVIGEDTKETDTNGESGIAGYYFSKDAGNTWSNIQTSSTYEFKNLLEKNKYSIQVKVVDNANNEKILSEDINTSSVSNLTDENCSVQSTPTIWTNQNVISKFTYTDTYYQIQTSADNEHWIDSDTVISESNGKIYARLTDGVSYGEVYTKEIKNIDKIAPAVPVIVAKQNNNSGDIYEEDTWTQNDVYLQFTSIEDGSGISRYEINYNGTWTTENVITKLGVGTIVISNEMDKEIQVRSFDIAGNMSEVSQIHVKIDKNNPEIPNLEINKVIYNDDNENYQVINNGDLVNNDLEVKMTSNDFSGISKFQQYFDENWQDIPFIEDQVGETYMYRIIGEYFNEDVPIRAIDNSGRISESAILRVRIDSTIPTPKIDDSKNLRTNMLSCYHNMLNGNYYNGFIDLSSGELGTSDKYPNAKYTDFIQIDQNKEYELYFNFNIYVNENTIEYDQYIKNNTRWRMYDKDYNYIGTSSFESNIFIPDDNVKYIRILWINGLNDLFENNIRLAETYNVGNVSYYKDLYSGIYYNKFLNYKTGLEELNTTYPNNVCTDFISVKYGSKIILNWNQNNETYNTGKKNIRYRFYDINKKYLYTAEGLDKTCEFNSSNIAYVRIMWLQGLTDLEKESMKICTIYQPGSSPMSKNLFNGNFNEGIITVETWGIVDNELSLYSDEIPVDPLSMYTVNKYTDNEKITWAEYDQNHNLMYVYENNEKYFITSYDVAYIRVVWPEGLNADQKRCMTVGRNSEETTWAKTTDEVEVKFYIRDPLYNSSNSDLYNNVQVVVNDKIQENANISIEKCGMSGSEIENFKATISGFTDEGWVQLVLPEGFSVDTAGNESQECYIDTNVIISDTPAVCNLNVQSDKKSITIDASSEAVTGVSGYYYSNDNGATWTSKQTSSKYKFNNLEPEKTYDIKVRVEDNVGNITDFATSKTTLRYEIYDEQDLIEFRTDVNNIDFSNSTIYLMDNIELSQDNWSPIGKISNFKGIFEGGNNIISKILIDGGNEQNYYALFYKNYGTIKDLTIADSTINGCWAAGIVGQNYGTIDNCVVNNDVTINGLKLAGGVVVKNYGTIKNCTNNAEVNCDDGFAAGIVTSSYPDDDDYEKYVDIINCTNNGNIGASNEGTAGICADSVNTKYNSCINNGTISGDDGCGGIIGKGTNAILNNCVSNDTATIKGNYNVGGLIGAIGYEDKSDICNSEIISCTNYASVSTNDTDWLEHVGGIAGSEYGNIKIDDCKNYGEITANNIEGGIVGLFDSTEFVSTITNSYNYGKINAQYGAGGIIGIAEKIDIENCTNEGEIVGTYDTGDQEIGGIVGTIEDDNSKIIKCTNNKNISGSNTIGGIIGKVSGENLKKFTMNQCINNGDVSTNDFNTRNIGGIVASLEADEANLINCTNNGSIQGKYRYNKDDDSFDDTENVAGCFGYVTGNKISIDNCNNYGVLTDGRNLAGIVGGVNLDGVLIIKNSSNNASITANDLGNIGAMVGWQNTDLNAVNIENCTNIGNITGSYNVGGLCGMGDYHIIGGYNSGIITGTTYDCIAGIVGGMQSGTITGTINTGKVTGRSNLGGIVGNVSELNNNVVQINLCTNKASIISNSDKSYTAGGIIGSVDDNCKVSITQCCNIQSTASDCISISSSSGYVIAGGILGNVDDTGIVNIDECYNNSKIQSNLYAGGIVGYLNDKSTVSNCYNLGYIFGNSSNEECKNDIGGIAGVSKGNINTCINRGNFGVQNTDYLDNEGSIVGYQEIGKVINSYYITGLGNNLGYGYSDNADNITAIAVTDAGLKNLSLTTLGDKWKHDASGYPVLQWQE